MRTFYGSKISEHMTTTPEGFLICLDVPIARTGTQEYLGYELGIDEHSNDVFIVNRTEDEVFSPATIASFEGKCVTEDHPPDSVTPGNVTAYNKGHAQHIRRGTGEQSDLLISDLFITDPRLIEEIRNGLREIACGYDCEYTEENGQIFQRRIRGNHIAGVPSGRAGHRVAIQDSSPEPEQTKGEKKTMEKAKHTNKTSNSLIARLFSRAVRDMEPDEVADTLDEIAQAAPADEAPAATPDAAPAPAAAPAAAPAGDSDFGPQILAAIKALGEQITAALAPAKAEPADADPIEQLVNELQAHAGETPADQEGSETIPADEMPGAQDEEPTPAPAASLPQNPIPGADRAAILNAISAIKPVIAALPESQRKAASDKAAAELRKMLGKDAKAKANGYNGVAATIQNAAKAKAKDSKKPQADNGEIGRSIMESRNPHYAKK